jgi:hypothetical protein
MSSPDNSDQEFHSPSQGETTTPPNNPSPERDISLSQPIDPPSREDVISNPIQHLRKDSPPPTGWKSPKAPKQKLREKEKEKVKVPHSDLDFLNDEIDSQKMLRWMASQIKDLRFSLDELREAGSEDSTPEFFKHRKYYPLKSSKEKLPKALELSKVGSKFKDHQLINSTPFGNIRIDTSKIINEIQTYTCPWPTSIPDRKLPFRQDHRKDFYINMLERQYTFSRNLFCILLNISSLADVSDSRVWIAFEKMFLLIRDNAQELQDVKQEALAKGTDFEEPFRLTYGQSQEDSFNNLTMCQLATMNPIQRNRYRTNNQFKNNRQFNRQGSRSNNEIIPTFPIQDSSNHYPKNVQASLKYNGGARDK